jgi:hypothetical protein
VKTLVGDHVVDVLRLADPEQTIQDLNDQLFGRHQYGARRNAIGEWEFFYYGKVDATPSADLSLAVLRAEGGPTFDLGSSPRTNRVVIRSKLFVEWQEADGGEPAPDNLVVRDAPATFDLSPDGLVLDSAIYGREEQAYDLPGYVGFYTDLSPLGLGQYGAHLAERVFDRHGRGAVQNTFTCLRDSVADSALLGDAVIISPSHLPNAQLGQLPTSQRGGSRWARVIQRTEGMAGPVLQVVDDSTGVAYAETPTVTVSPSETADPEFFYDALIAGVTQCQADGARVEVQFALGSAVPSAGNPYTILNAALFVDDASAVVDPWTETLGPFVRGQTVWFRVRAYRYSGAPGSWSAWASIGGVITGPLTTLSDLVISGETDEGADLDWSYDESPPVGEVLVQYRDISGLVGPYLDYGSPLAAGTETLTMTGLNTGTKYQVRLTLIDGSSAEYGDQLGGIFTTTGGKISNLSVTSITSTGAKLLWTNTDGVQFVLVEYRVTGAASYRVYALLPATSTRVRLAGLQPVTDYDVRVSLGKTGGNGAGGPALTDSFTTLATTDTLDPPLFAGVFGAFNPFTGLAQNGLYGIKLFAHPFNPMPHDLVILEAVETAVDSDTPGSFAEVATVPAVSGNATYWTNTAPNDGKLRYLKALSRAAGFNDSGETVYLGTDPWAATPEPPIGGGIINILDITSAGLASGANGTGFAAFADGAEIFRLESPNGKEFRVRLYKTQGGRDADLARLDTDHSWPSSLLLDARVTSGEGFTLDLDPVRVRILLAQLPDLLTYWTLTNDEAGMEDITCRIWYFAVTSDPQP